MYLHWNEEKLKMEGNYAEVGLVFFLFAIFCAYWAQENSRNAWLWFFCGFLFAPITGLFLLTKNWTKQKGPNKD